eukprot:359401-Chlamydomonas_euryale.AAC.2
MHCRPTACSHTFVDPRPSAAAISADSSGTFKRALSAPCDTVEPGPRFAPTIRTASDAAALRRAVTTGERPWLQSFNERCTTRGIPELLELRAPSARRLTDPAA